MAMWELLDQASMFLEVLTAWMLGTSSAVATFVGPEAFTVSLLLAALLAVALQKKEKKAVKVVLDSLVEEDFMNMGMPLEPHLEGGFLPPTRLIHSNSSEAFDFENENCSGQFLVLHRPTQDPELNSSGAYPYGDYFEGKKWRRRSLLLAILSHS